MRQAQPDWLKSTLLAVREVMQERLERAPTDPEMERDIQMALEELEVMWEELEGQAELLRRESERYQAFFDFAPDAYLISDTGCNIREANRAAAELLRVPRDDLVGRPLSQFVSDKDRTPFLTRFVSMVLSPGARTLTWECELQPASGKAMTASISVRAIPLRRSGVAGLCWLIRPG